MTNETRLKFYLTDPQIYLNYLGDFSLTEKFHSPFREDPGPSFMIKNIGTSSTPEYLWTDFGLESSVMRDAIGFVQQLYEITRKQAVNKIWKEMVIDPDFKLKRVRFKHPIKLSYEFEHQELRGFELTYWNKLGISKELLEFYNIHSLKAMRRLGRKIWESLKDNPTYIYLFKKRGAFKAYRPLDRNKDKFRGQNNGDILEGYEQLPKYGDHLIITSSLKDTVVLRNMGILATNPTSENSKKGLHKKVFELNQRFKKIYILFDNDIPGIRAAQKLSMETGWEVMHLPRHLAKDPSDCVMNCGNYLELSIFFSKFALTKYHI